MSRLQDVQKFIDLSHAVSSPADLQTLLADVTKEVGFDHFALIQHVDLRPFDPGLTHMDRGELVAMMNYPESWIEYFIEHDLVGSDPMLLASQRSPIGFAWDTVPKLIRMNRKHHKILDAAGKVGLSSGFTVPVNVPGEANGSVSFAVRAGLDLPVRNLPMVHLIASYAFNAALNLVRKANPQSEREVHLTQRQLDCLLWVARGKSDWEISQILGLSEETVKKHIRDARERYDVSKRIQLVMRAVFDGKMPLIETLR